MKLLLIFVGVYLAGSVNFAILLLKLFNKNDPRTYFSKNPGTFNVYRQFGIRWAAAVFILDLGRAMGVAAAMLCLLETNLVPWAGLVLVLGNRFPCLHGFQGGKGVANYLGFSVIIVPISAAIAVILWLITYAIFRIPFIASFVMVFIIGGGYLMLYGFDPIPLGGVLATQALIYYSHKSNIMERFRYRN